MTPGSGDMLRDGLTWLEQMRTAHCSSPVEYRAPGRTPDAYTVNATYGKTDVEVADETSRGGLTINSQVWDFLILADELASEPGPGDVIAANGRLYEVMALGPDFRGWRWSDPYRTTYRIHTKDIGLDA